MSNISLQPDDVNLWHFKLYLFDLNIIHSLKYQKSTTLSFNDIEVIKVGVVINEHLLY